MSTPQTLTEYLKAAGNLPETGFMGVLVMYSFTGTKRANVTHDAMQVAYAQAGLNTAFLPGAPTETQAFKNATGEKQGRFHYKIGSTDHFAEIKPVSRVERGTINRELWSFRLGADGNGLDGRAVGRVTFYRPSTGGSRVRFQLYNGQLGLPTAVSSSKTDPEHVALERFLQQISDDYDWYCTYLYDQPIRQSTMAYVEKGLNGIKVLPSGGCYFVHKDRWDELRNLRDAIQGLHGGFQMTLTPIPNLPELRETYIEAFQREATQDVLQLVSKIQERQKSSRVSTATLQEMAREVQGIAQRAEEHGRKFGIAQDDIANALEIAHESLAGLARMVS